MSDNSGFFSYPQISYGVQDWAAASTTYTKQAPALVLPQKVSNITSKDLWATLNYSINVPSNASATEYDLSFDDFVTNSLPPVWGSTMVEVMVMFSYRIQDLPLNNITEIGTMVNSKVSTQPWAVRYFCQNNNNELSIQYFYQGGGPNGMQAGIMAVNMSAIFRDAAARAASSQCWNGPKNAFGSMYLDQLNLGSEESGGSSAIAYNWTIDAYCYELPSAVSASALGCPQNTLIPTVSSTTSVTQSTTTMAYGLVAGNIVPAALVMDQNQLATLHAGALGGVAPYMYQWYTGNNCNSAISSSSASNGYIIGPSISTNYSYMVKDSNMPQHSACSHPLHVIVNPPLRS